jgi:hypothetical protein
MIEDLARAARLARAIASDIALYNADKVARSLAQDTFFTELAPEFDEGRRLYLSRVAPSLDAAAHQFERAIVDVILLGKGHIAGKVW